MTPEKFGFIKDLLAAAFPGYVIEDEEDKSKMIWRFKVLVEGSSPLVAFSDEFIDDLTIPQIKANIERWRIIELMRDNPKKRILVTHTGPVLEERG